MRIIVDAHGGDKAPLEVVKACAAAVDKFDVDIVLVGRSMELQRIIAEHMIPCEHIEICDATDIVTMEDDPLNAVRHKKDSSMIKGLRMLSSGDGDAFVSAGSTAALLTGATLIVKRIEGVGRAALGTVLPAREGPAFLIDCGANAEVKPEYLLQFGIMGSAYAEGVLGIKKPTVGLLNIGQEPEKGTVLQRQAYELLKESELNFIGNVEGRDLLASGAQVIVADGYSGNIALKTAEGVAIEVGSRLKAMFKSGPAGAAAYLLLKGKVAEFKASMDYREYGGAPFLGIKKPVIKAHGSSDETAFCNAIGQAKAVVESAVVRKITEGVAAE